MKTNIKKFELSYFVHKIGAFLMWVGAINLATITIVKIIPASFEILPILFWCSSTIIGGLIVWRTSGNAWIYGVLSEIKKTN